MAKKTVVNNKKAEIAEEQEEFFPEIDVKGNPTHKKLFATAKAYHRAKSERAQVLSTMKEKQDNYEQQVVVLMHEAKITKFNHKGVLVELTPGREKAQVKIDGENDLDSADDE